LKPCAIRPFAVATAVLRRTIGQLFMVGAPGPPLDTAPRDFLVAAAPGGVVLCKRNVPSATQLRRLARELHGPRPGAPPRAARAKAELVPFAAAIRSGIPALMTAHVVYPVLDARLPATLSPSICTTLLRKRLRFDGVLFSDDLEMHAVAGRATPEEIAPAA